MPAPKTCRIMRAPRSTRGASRGVLECGSGAVVLEGCNTHTRAKTAEAVRSRRASRASPGAQGGCAPCDCLVARAQPRPQQRWRGTVPDEPKGTAPERSVHRGSCGAGFKHRARDVGEDDGLAVQDNPDGASSKSIVPPDRREAVRPVGPSGPRRPAPPSLLDGAATLKPRAKTRRENGSGCVVMPML